MTNAHLKNALVSFSLFPPIFTRRGSIRGFSIWLSIFLSLSLSLSLSPSLSCARARDKRNAGIYVKVSLRICLARAREARYQRLFAQALVMASPFARLSCQPDDNRLLTPNAGSVLRLLHRSVEIGANGISSSRGSPRRTCGECRASREMVA